MANRVVRIKQNDYRLGELFVRVDLNKLAVEGGTVAVRCKYKNNSGEPSRKVGEMYFDGGSNSRMLRRHIKNCLHMWRY
jgi:hypothetical protein